MIWLCGEKTLRAACPPTGKPRVINLVYTWNPDVQTSVTGGDKRDGNPLYHLVWQPFDQLLKGVKTVYYSPAGLINLISLAALPVNGTACLAEKYDLVRMGSTRDLVSPAEKSLITNAVVYGGINYDTLLPAAIAKAGSPGNTSAGAMPGEIAFNGAVRAGFGYLPGTLQEAQTIAGSLTGKGIKSTTLTGLEAREETFTALSGASSAPSLIHISTHGFYLPDTISVKNRKNVLYSPAGEIQFRYSEDPLQRSGLLMAGANLTWKGLPRPQGTEDGILTAREVSNMNLSNTRLAVLSACQTGLGDVKGSEGVEGLERGFKMAGVRNIVMSLWQVPDKETTEFMTNFYKSWLEGLEFHEAFRTTQVAMRKKYPQEPFKWAGFVMVE
jgi:CHAT domain-containing protein